MSHPVNVWKPRIVEINLDVKASYRSSCPDVFCKKGALRNFAKFTGKYLCQSLFCK